MFGMGTSVSPLEKSPERDRGAAQTASWPDIQIDSDSVAFRTLLRSKASGKNPHANASDKLLWAACRVQEENQSGQVFVR